MQVIFYKLGLGYMLMFYQPLAGKYYHTYI